MSVAACTAADVVSIMEKKRQPLEEYRLEVTGERVSDYPRKFVSFHVHHIVRGRSISEKALADAVRRAVRHFMRYDADYYLILAGDHRYRMDYGLLLDAPPFRLLPAVTPPGVVIGPRICITKAVDKPWRFGIAGSGFLSRRFAEFAQ